MADNRPLLSTQHDPYQPYGQNNDHILSLGPYSWFPSSNARVIAMILYYILCILLNIGGIVWPLIKWYPNSYFIEPHRIEWGWYFVYIAIWIQIFQIIFFFIAFIDLLKRYSPITRCLHRFKERFYDAAFSLTFLNMVVYCSFVLPYRINNIGEQSLTVDIWGLDFIQHVLPFILILIETIIVHHTFAHTLCSFFLDMFWSLIVYGCYVGFSYYAHEKNHLWPYPHQADMNKHQIIAFYSIGAIVLLFGYLIAKLLSKCLWADKIQINSETGFDEPPADISNVDSFVISSRTMSTGLQPRNAPYRAGYTRPSQYGYSSQDYHNAPGYY